MGCGSSTIYGADGTIAPGKGEVKVTLPENSEYEVVMYWYGDGSKVAYQEKNMAGTDPKKWVWEDVGSPGSPGFHTLKLKPCLKQQRWVVDDVRILYPEQPVPDLCKKLHAEHKKDEEKFPKNLKKAAEKKKEHPYNENPDWPKADCDALGGFVTPHQMADNMGPMKEALVGIEDALPGNNLGFRVEIVHDKGFVKDGKVEGLSPQEMIEQKLPIDKKYMAMQKKNEVVSKAAAAAVMGLCKGVGTTKEELLPNLEALLDEANGKRPLTEVNGGAGYDRLATYQSKMGDAKPDPEAEEKERLEYVKYLLEEDKKDEAEVKEKDKNIEEQRKQAQERLKSQYEFCKNALTPLAEGSITKGTRVLARYKGFHHYEGVLTSDVYTKESNKVVDVTFDDGDHDTVKIEHVCAENVAPIADEDLYVGASIRAKFFGDIWQPGTIEGRNADGTFIVKYDLVFTEKKVKREDIRRDHELTSVARRTVLVSPEFYDVEFAWLQADLDLEIELNLWRECDEENKQKIPLKPFQKKKLAQDGTETTEDIHGGYKALVPIRRFRSYCYNFKVGDKYFVNYKKECGEKDFKRFKLNARG